MCAVFDVLKNFPDMHPYIYNYIDIYIYQKTTNKPRQMKQVFLERNISFLRIQNKYDLVFMCKYLLPDPEAADISLLIVQK